MARHIHVIAWMLAAVLAAPAMATAQADPGVWRAFAEKVDIGTELTVRLLDGRRFNASLVQVRDDAVLLQPKTRVPVPVQAVPYDAILSLARREGGVSAGKAAAIGVASGAGTFFAILLILLGTID